MADKKIEIHLASSADLRAMRDASEAAAKMASDVERTNVAVRQSVLKSAAAYDSLAAKADKAAKAMSGEYRDYLAETEKKLAAVKAASEQWDKMATSALLGKIAAEKNDRLAKTGKDIDRLANFAGRARGKVSELSGAVQNLFRNTGSLGKAIGSLAKGGLWAAAAAGLRLMIDLMAKAWRDFEEKLAAMSKAVTDNLEKMAGTVKEYKNGIAEVAEAELALAAASLNNRKTEIALTERLAKATIELARQKRIAAGEDAESVDAQSADALSALSSRSARESAQAEISAALSRLEAAEKERDAAIAETERLRGLRAQVFAYDFTEDKDVEKAKELARAYDGQIADARKLAFKAYERVKAEEKALENARRAAIALEDEIAAQELKTANERTAKKAAAEKAAAEKAAAERERAERDAEKAAEKAARERERLDREAHQKRMADLREEIALQDAAASERRSVVAAARTEFERAFAMWRDPSRAAEEIGEERARSEDLKRLHRAASRYGGKWRIDELSALMAAGDTQGVQSTLEAWRKSARFTPETEALVRAAAAEQTQTTVENELRKIEQNTGGLAEKLDELISMKGD